MKTKLLRLVTAVSLILTILAFTPATVFAAGQGSCTSGDTTKVQLYENVSGDTSDGNDYLWLCGNSSNLDGIAHQPAGNCNSQVVIGGSTTWNNCVSSFRAWVPSGQTLCFYNGSGYTSYMNQYKVGPHVGETRNAFTLNDTLTSLKWVTGGPTNCI